MLQTIIPILNAFLVVLGVHADKSKRNFFGLGAIAIALASAQIYEAIESQEARELAEATAEEAQTRQDRAFSEMAEYFRRQNGRILPPSEIDDPPPEGDLKDGPSPPAPNLGLPKKPVLDIHGSVHFSFGKSALAAQKEANETEPPLVLYYQKNADSDFLDNNGRTLKEVLESGVPDLYRLVRVLESNSYYDDNNLPTNYVICGTETPVNRVKKLAHAMLDMGFKIQYVGGYFDGERNTNASIIDVRSGGDVEYFETAAVWSHKDIDQFVVCNYAEFLELFQSGRS